MWQRLTDGTLFKKEVAAEQGDDGAGVEDPEAEAVPLIGGEAVEDSDAGEELLAEDGAMMELGRLRLQTSTRGLWLWRPAGCLRLPWCSRSARALRRRKGADSWL